MKLNDNDIIDVLLTAETVCFHIDGVKEVVYNVALCLANKYKKDNPRFNSGEFLSKLLS
jgi:hypothetical protein